MSGLVAQGYTVVTPVTYQKLDANGDPTYSGELAKGGYNYALTIVKAGSLSTANQDLQIDTLAAKALGFTGEYTSISGYSTAWVGVKYSGDTAYAYVAGVLDANNWVVSLVAA